MPVPLLIVPVLTSLGLISSGYVASDVARWWNTDDGTPLDNLKVERVAPSVFTTTAVVAGVASVYIFKKLQKK